MQQTFNHDAGKLREALGISEQRNSELLDLFLEMVSKKPEGYGYTASELIEAIYNSPTSTLEKLYLLWKTMLAVIAHEEAKKEVANG